ncbi:MAG: amidohydrolase [Gemmatimonadetes bacterium]|nr:amidohydrolase [Gemmatimonadota bacterium]
MTSRRTFLGQTAALAALPATARALGAVPRDGGHGPLAPLRPTLPPQPFETPELVLVNGDLLTQDPALPRAEALAIARGRIVAIGSNADMRALARAGTTITDLGRKVVIPGVIDAHNHPVYAGVRHLYEVDCDLRSIGAIQAALRERAARTPAGEWIRGFKYDDTKTKEGRFLTRADLDAVSTTHPIYVEHRGGHTGYVNSLAFARAHVTADTPNPAGGRFERDANGQLTGRVAETAAGVIRAADAKDYTRDDYARGAAEISRRLVATGVTSATEAQGTPTELLAYQDAREAGTLRHRAYCHINYAFVDRMIAAGVRTGLGDEWVRVGAVKCISDGSISERTALLAEPYVGRPSDRGIEVMKAEELWTIFTKVHAAGWQIGTHANGDAAIEIVTGLYERLIKAMPRKDPRLRYEHCTVLTPELIARIKALGAIPTPFASYVYFHGEKMGEYGAKRTGRMFPMRWFLDAGIRAAMGSDYPPGPFEPMMALTSMTTRTDLKGTTWGANQRITLAEALTVLTMNGAYASYEEHLKGSLTVGKLADLVVLGRDPRTVPAIEIVNVPIERTMVGGRWVYES